MKLDLDLSTRDKERIYMLARKYTLIHKSIL